MLTLSARLSIALSTKPPIPFVGEAGRPLLPIGDLRSPGEGSSFGASSIDAGGDFTRVEPNSVAAVVFEKRLLKVLSLIELVRDGEPERMLSGGGLSASAVESRDLSMPGNLILPAL